MKTAGLKIARVIFIVAGSLFIAFFGFLLIGLFVGDGSDPIAISIVIGGIIFLTPGVVFIYLARTIKRKLAAAHKQPLAASFGSNVDTQLLNREPSSSLSLIPASCPSCGANTAIPQGQVIQCEYCGTSLSASSRQR